MDGLLIANRGEIAVRILRAARESGLRTVAVAPADDEGSLHVLRAGEFHRLPGAGVAAYLDGSAILAAARATGCGLIHPGYGLLSENAAFARACAAEGVTFVGPSPDVLDLFGDKTAARAFARQADVPVIPGTDGPTTLAQARTFAEAHGPVMVKAVAGGGGRGMRVVGTLSELDEAFERCAGEAVQAFGNGDLYVEALVPSARHIEVQIVADGTGAVQHLWERDCSIQRRHQKLVEIAPSPALDSALRDRLLMAAVRLAAAARYTGVGTVEFLVSGDDFWFLEVNPRLQVEHTVTEEITGVDLVRTQLKIALGIDIGFAATPRGTGFAVQTRVNLETLDADGTTHPHAGTLTAFTPPSGPGVRVDTYGYTGYRTSPRYDSLLAKVIARGDDALAAVGRAQAALAEFQIDGVPTNIPVLRAILRHPDVAAGRAGTSFVADHAAEFAAPHTAVEPVAVDGLVVVSAPMDGTVASVDVAEGDVVGPGARLAVLEAMKMEHVVRADRGGVVRSVAVGKADTVAEGAALVYFVPDDAASAVSKDEADHDVWAPEVEEIRRRRSRAYDMGGPDKIARQHATRRFTVRERIALLADPESFREIGVLTGFAEYDAAGGLTSILPANFVAGTARIDGRQVVLGADDFTVRGGSGDAAIHAKQVYAEQYAREMRLPVVRLLDGASGGGSVKMAQEAGFTYVPVNPAWDAVVDNLSLVPVVAACLGPTVGLGAARLVMSHLAVLVAGTGQLFTAGPPVVRGATGEDLTKEELGGVDVHRSNGAVERFAATEEEAFDILRRFLSYLPGSVFELPPVVEYADPVDQRLLGAVPRDRRVPYRIEPILDAIFDEGSVFRYAEYGGSMVTALARLAGHPVGVLATDPFRGATMSVEGAQAVTRLVDLCETFHLPVVSLTDQAGMTIGAAAERRATIRHGARAIAAVYQARVPQAELILRRVYGVGGAGIVNRHRASRTWAWPSADWGSLPVEGGVEAAFRAQLAASADPEADIARLRAQLAAIASPFRTAEHFGVQDLIDPRVSRTLLCEWVRDAYRVLPELTGRPSFGTRP
ncbi:MAG TPA: carboxyl transferase domain-containing protein [Pseudonocardiaceae bacterium]|nr:carboxyl transferase domain-containing protein [Pseudonocardiaceae bacterium]